MFEGPWRLGSQDDLTKGMKLLQGIIVRHRSGAIILNCPACNSMQFAASKLIGTPEMPTLESVIHCGAGHCKKCGIWFTVQNGKTVVCEKPEVNKIPISDKLKAAGVKRPPKLPDNLR